MLSLKSRWLKIVKSKRLKATVFLAFLLSATFVLTACGSQEPPLLSNPIIEQVDTMGTYVKITSYTPNTETAAKSALKIAQDYDKWATVDQSGSLVDEINRQAGIASVKVNAGLYQLIKDAYSLSSQKTGYDVTVGPLTRLWHIGFPDAKLPTQAEIDAVLPLINYQFIKLDDKAQTVYLTQKGAQLDLGSMTKGYVARLITENLKKAGVKNAVVDLGSSSLYVLGHGPRGVDSSWNVGIKDPNNPDSENIGILTAKNEFISTSGIYERQLTVNGKTYPHILNPKTGYPFDNDIQSVTIVGADNPTYGDGISTAVFALGTKKGYDYVLAHHLQAIFIDKGNKVYVTPGLEKLFTLNSASKYRLSTIADAS